jgi:hypothetical protein
MGWHPLFPYLETCNDCQGYGRDHEGARCQECGGNGCGPDGGTHPRVSATKAEDAAPIQSSRKVWPHTDAMTAFDPMSVHRHGDRS